MRMTTFPIMLSEQVPPNWTQWCTVAILVVKQAVQVILPCWNKCYVAESLYWRYYVHYGLIPMNIYCMQGNVDHPWNPIFLMDDNRATM